MYFGGDSGVEVHISIHAPLSVREIYVWQRVEAVTVTRRYRFLALTPILGGEVTVYVQFNVFGQIN